MLNIKEKNRIEKYSTYTPKITKILFDYFKLSEIPVKVDNQYKNCSFEWSTFFRKPHDIKIDVNNIDKGYKNRVEYYRKRHQIEINSFLDLFLVIVLHEIGHYYYFRKLGYDIYTSRSYQENYKKHDNRLCEKDADVFAKNNFSGAKLFLQEVLK